MAGPPVREQAKRARKLPAFRGQLVRGAWRSLGIRPRYQKRVAFQPLEALRQDVSGDPRDLLQQLVEPPRSGEQGLHNEQSPTIADLSESIGERGGRALGYGGILFAHRQTVSAAIDTLRESSNLQVTTNEEAAEMGALDGIQEEIQRVAEQVGNAVVGVGQRWGVGSGVVLAKGQILTNAHNVRRDEVTVTFPDGHTATGQVLGHDVDGDLAVIGVETADLSAIEWATGNTQGIGAPVFALSNPGGRGLRVTLGFVTGVERSFRGPRGRRITGSIEHDAPLLPGSSGGPIVTADGRLVGLNTHRLGEGFYLAIPADESLRARVDALAQGETKGRVRLGVGVAPSDVARGLRRAVGLPDAEGLLVRLVEDDSPASRAGLATGDLIVRAAGEPVRSIDDLFKALEAAADNVIELVILRGAEERAVEVQLGGEGTGRE
jgi:serine protease Do